MKRPRLFELEDLDWFPRSVRDAGTDFLRFQWQVSGAVKPIAGRLMHTLSQVGTAEIVDLASGGGGPILAIYEELTRSGCMVHVTLSDRFPNLGAFHYLSAQTNGDVGFVAEPVDATAVPSQLRGLRTMFAAIHHFPPDLVRAILEDAVRQRAGIAVFDFSAPPSPPPLGALLLGNPLGIVLATPFVRPFRWSRLFWTYLVPIVPFYFAWDAFASGFRLYSVAELRSFVKDLPANDYVWEIDQEPFPHCITYAIGRPPAMD